MLADDAHRAAERFEDELECLAKIVAELKQLEPDERSRVLLITILRLAPDALSDSQYLSLIRQAKAVVT